MKTLRVVIELYHGDMEETIEEEVEWETSSKNKEEDVYEEISIGIHEVLLDMGYSEFELTEIFEVDFTIGRF